MRSAGAAGALGAGSHRLGARRRSCYARPARGRKGRAARGAQGLRLSPRRAAERGGRLFADVDLLAPEAALGHVEARLVECGWHSAPLTPYDEHYYRLWTHELPPLTHPEREIELDLHHNVIMRTARLQPDARLLLEAARPVAGSRYQVLAPIDMVLHAMTHLLYGGEMDDGLRDLVDLDDLLRHFARTEPRFWEGFWPRARQLDLERPAFYGLRYAARLLGTPVPEALLRESQSGAPPAPVVALMDRLVPEALFPQHPDYPSEVARAARLLLFMRSHWVRMPPVLLLRHLSYKFYRRHLGRGGRPGFASGEAQEAQPGVRG